MTNASQQIANRHFGARNVRKLAKAGVSVISLQALPVGGSFLNTETGYVLNDNGTCRVKTLLEIYADYDL